jgi:hypothetical protein
MDGDMIYTKGDANDTADLAPIAKSQIVGTYMFQIPKVGYIMAKGGKYIWFIVAGIVALLNLAAGFLVRSDDDDDEDKTEEKAPEAQEASDAVSVQTVEVLKSDEPENTPTNVAANSSERSTAVS